MKTHVLLFCLLLFASIFPAQELSGSEESIEEPYADSVEEFKRRLPREWLTVQGLLIAMHNKSNSVSVSRIGDDGALAPVHGSPFSTGEREVRALHMSVDEKYLFAAHRNPHNCNSHDIDVIRIGDDGSLSTVKDSPFSTGECEVKALHMSVDGKHLFAANWEQSDITTFKVEDGALIKVACASSDREKARKPVTLSMSVDGRYLFVGNWATDSISGFKVESDGVLTEVTGSPFATKGKILTSLSMSAGGRYLFACSQNSNSISVFSVKNNGALAHVKGSPFSFKGSLLGALVMSTDGKYLFAGSNGTPSFIHTLRIGNNGALTHVSGSPFVTEEWEIGALHMSKDGKYLFAGQAPQTKNRRVGSNTIGAFRVEDNGILTKVAGSPFAASGVQVESLCMSVNGRYLFASDWFSDEISAFRVEDNGSLTAMNRPSMWPRLCAMKARPSDDLRSVPLPQRWQYLQKAELVSALRGLSSKTLPENIENKIVEEMVLGRKVGVLPKEFKTYVGKKSLEYRAHDMTFAELVDCLSMYQYDRSGIAGGLLHILASLFVPVKRGSLTPEGFRLLQSRVQNTSSEEFDKAHDMIRERLQVSTLSRSRRNAYEAIGNHLSFLHRKQMKLKS